MANYVNYIREKITKFLPRNRKTILVLKGIPIRLYNPDFKVNVGEILKNKFAYFAEIINNDRNVITYDEFLALYEFITAQYTNIIVLVNNLFINYFPLEVDISEADLRSLLIHYNAIEETGEEENEEELEDLSEITKIYANIKVINGNYYVVYNNILPTEKEQEFYLFDGEDINTIHLEKEEISFSGKYYKITSEEDYLLLVDDVYKRKYNRVYVLDEDPLFMEVFLQKIRILKYIFPYVTIKLGVIREGEAKIDVRQEFFDILKKYWGYSNFKTLKVYDINSLHNKQKIVKEVSQGEIIARIVEEVEKCYTNQNYRDIFVTAPTGSGKSIMFQIPAIYLAEKYELFTIVISPLIGLMKDQVSNLEMRNYTYARTINSDISPIKKQEIINDIIDKKCHILYLSPESLLSKSDLDQIIGNRKLGLLVVDEAHIVTTWGKQFRPDYWYLGDHLSKVKKAQLEKKGLGFVIATFTATAIYGGIENMYRETVDSLKMIDPITYLGFVKRNNIRINIEKDEPITNKVEYELNKFDQLLDKMDYALMFNKKMLIYFPTVALLERFWEYCLVKNLDKYISKYHGRLTPYEKEESYRRFRNGETPVILATKAFGMGIDIDDIEIVAHFAPTGNVCDYVQEIGRAARRSGLIGEAYYHFMRNDFKHINRLHGLSVIKEYQLIEVIKKVYKLYQEKIKDSKGKIFTKKRNEMLVDAESFAHIFENPFYNEDDSINKVKTAMLLIQKDFEQRFGFSPFHIRPIPLFEIGYFEIDPNTQESITKKYGKVLEELDSYYHICEINLKKIWEKDFCDKYSFPRFKFLLYSKDEELLFDYKNIIKPALKIDITFYNNWLEDYKQYLKVLREIVSTSVREEKYYSVDGKDGLVEELVQRLNVSEYKAKSIIETIISAMSIYQHDYTNNIHGRVFNERILNSGNYKYKFSNEVFEFFKWFDRQVDYIRQNTKNGILYLVEGRDKDFKEKMVALGILEVFGVLVFKSLGGRNSQIYIYVNQTKTMREILLKPTMYKNRLLELIRNRHKLSVEMLSYIFENNLSNEEIWGIIEDYFLGIIPEQVKERYENDIVKAR